ncbi:MAG: cobaltochelatase subunit CobT [Gammaproteobacteria bacterium]|nr:cobaltochelatase subunit CobT [Gammaproteobacteria bacterium]
MPGSPGSKSGGKPSAPRPFERALAPATRALAADGDLQVVFGPAGPRLEGDKMLLPPTPAELSPRALALSRGQADRLALRRAFHDPDIHARHRPTGARARNLYDSLEDIRCQAMGARDLAGVAANVDAALRDDLQRSGVLRGPADGSAAMTQALALWVRESLAHLAVPEEAATMVARWRPFLEQRLGKTLPGLLASAADQEAFARAQHAVIKALGLGHELPPPTPERREPQGPATADRPAREPPPRPAPTEAEATPVQEAREITDDEEPDIAPEQPLAEPASPKADGDGEAQKAPEGQRLSRISGDENDHPDRNYRVYTTRHDEVLDAEALCDEATLTELRASLDEQARQLPGVVARLARRLERFLLAQQRRGWQFDLEEGMLDPARLARAVTDPLAPLAFRQEREIEFKDTVVTLLLDNSGSMRGRPILLTALCADLLTRTLERCGVRTEILGFTTREWDGGQARRDWIAAGAPRNPGRLTDVRYIVYKTADTAWRRARRNLGLLLRDDIMKDNIDGEALWWAHQRLVARREQRRILMVISDGVPLDQATLSANPGGYLDQHLRDVIRWIERRSDVELAAIGIGHEVGDYYRRAVAIGGTEELGPAMIGQLAQLFAPRGAEAKPRPRPAALSRP